ncbi:prolyl oligopeptidase family serine peptidase [Pelomonas baiyunensis]|uniref:prolyl oligopeptidase n=1 Tax=Pelomonas baiyunensis TaxID=3299026 RepID=A0ABW7H0Q3_9BURK
MKKLMPWVALSWALVAWPAAASSLAGAPLAPVEVVTDDYYGTSVADPYRWMESGKDPRWMPWLQGQAAHTDAVLAQLPGRAALLKDIQARSGDQTAYAMVREVGAQTFIQRRDVGAEDPRLYVRTGGQERLLLDPATVLGSPQALDWWQVSPNGRHVAVGLSKRGTEASVLHVVEVASGRLLAPRIAGTDFGAVSWLPDSSGFAYLQFVGEQGTPNYYVNSEIRLHRLGAAGPDRTLVARKRPPVPLQPQEIVSLHFAERSPAAMLVISEGRRESQVYVTDRAALLAGKARWTRVGGYDAQLEGAGLAGEALWLLSTREASNGRLLVTSARRPDLRTARMVALPGQPVIEGFHNTRDGALVRTIEGGQMGLWRVPAQGEPQRVALPFAGSVMVMSTSASSNEAYVALAGWTQPSAVYRLNAQGQVAATGMSSQPAGYDAARYEARTQLATAADGTRIPYTVLSLKGRAAQGPGPLLLEAYGAYGFAAMPFFQTSLASLLDRGGRYVIAHVRGGGEFGRDWHYGGRGPTKANTWNDAIAVAETLVRDRETTPAQLAVMGTSAGGVMVGQAVNTRPDLFAAAVANVGFMNPVRYVSEQNNADIPEWGGPIADAASFKTMFNLDPYQHIRPGTAYPATLVVSGLNDPRAATFHSAKYAARLAAATNSGRPVLLRIDFGAGHGMGSTRTQRDAMWADIYSFVLWRTGDAAFQPAP